MSVSDQSFIDRSAVREITVDQVEGLLEPYPDSMMGVDHTAAYRIHAQRVGRQESISCVVIGQWVANDGRFYFYPSGVMQNANGPGSMPDFQQSNNWSLRSLAGQLVTEFAEPSQEVKDYEAKLANPALR